MSDSILHATEMDYGRMANHNRTEVLQGRAAARSEGMVYRNADAMVQKGTRELG